MNNVVEDDGCRPCLQRSRQARCLPAWGESGNKVFFANCVNMYGLREFLRRARALTVQPVSGASACVADDFLDTIQDGTSSFVCKYLVAVRAFRGSLSPIGLIATHFFVLVHLCT